MKLLMVGKHLLSLLLFFLLLCTYTYGQNYQRTYESGVVHVKFKEAYGNSLQAHRVTTEFGLSALDALNESHEIVYAKRLFPDAGKFEAAHRAYGLHLWYEIKIDKDIPISQVVKAYGQLDYFQKVEPCLKYESIGKIENQLMSSFTTPTNDPLFSQQWHYKNTGQGGGTIGADISLPEAWAIESGKNNVIVAVIDGGIDSTHPDLAAAVWINADEIPGNGIDDDANGYVDDINGYGFGDNTGTIAPHYHATHVGGTIGGVTNNGVGVSGIAGGSGTGDGVRLMSCAGFGATATGGFEAAMVYAADNGAVISQNSWGGGSTSIEAAIDYFVARAGYDNSTANFSNKIQIGPMAGGIVIFAAGNSNSSDPTIGYPASYSPVMAVASTDRNDIRSSFSNYGSWVDIAAPGSEVFSTYPVSMGSYATLSGTSMACPHVSGVAALIVSKFGGTTLTPSQVRDRLIFSTDNLDSKNPGFIGKLGSGRLNAFQALQSPDAIAPAPISDLIIKKTEFNSVTLGWTATGGSNFEGTASNYDIRYSTSPINSSNFASATAVSDIPKPQPSGSSEQLTAKGLVKQTTYYFAIKASDYYGNISSISNITSTTTGTPPVINVTPASLTESLFTGGTSAKNLTLTNTGGSNLKWKVETTSSGTPSSLSQPETILLPASSSINNIGETMTTTSVEVPLALGDITSLVSSSVAMTCISADSETGIIYGQANLGTAFYKYDASLNSWQSLATSPISSGNNGGSVFLKGKVYTVYTGNGSQMGVYDVASNSWATISNGLGSGTGNITTDGSYLYLVSGSTFKRYDPALNVWTSLSTPTIAFESWGGLNYYNGIIYGHVGNGNTGFSKYTISTNSWVSLPSLPNGAVLGCAIDPVSKQYVTYGSYGGNSLYIYDIIANSWSVKTISLFSVGDGGLGFVGKSGVSGIYFIQGENGSGLGKFETKSLSTWLTVTPTGGDLAASGNQLVTVGFNAAGLNGGTYLGEVKITSNDPVKPTVTVPITLTVTGAPDININKTLINYGQRYIGQAVDSIVVVKNAGTDNLAISGIGSDNARFTVTPSTMSLTPGQSGNLTIHFNPIAIGIVTGHVTLMSNDPDEGAVIISLSGEGLVPPVIGVTPSSLSASLLTGATSTKNLTLTNTGGSNLKWKAEATSSSTSSSLSQLETIILPVSSSINNNGETTITSSTWLTVTPASGDLAASGNQVVTVGFNAAGLNGGIYHGEVKVTSNDPVLPSVTVPVTLTVTGIPNISINKSLINYGQRYIGQASDTIVVVKNVGTDNLIISGIGSDNARFTVTPSTMNLTPGQSANLTIRFSPIAVGIVTGHITLISNDPDEATVIISVKGEGVTPPVIGVTPSSLNVSLYSGETTTRNLTLTNTGGSNLKWKVDVTSSNTPSSLSQPEPTILPASSGMNHVGETMAISSVEVPLALGDMTSRASSPVGLTCISSDANTGIVYGQAKQSSAFFKYDASSNSWQLLAPSSLTGNNGGSVFLKGKVYTVYTSSSTQMGVYDVASNSWTTMSNGLGYSTTNITTDGSYIYLVSGSIFKRYDPASNAWTSLSSPSMYFSSWGGLSYYNGIIYGHAGDGSSEFSKYTISTNSWTYLPSLPAGATQGSAIDPVSKQYLTYGPYGSNNLYVYNITTNSWNAKTISLFSVNYGGLGFVGKSGVSGIYFIQGGPGLGFGKYETKPLLSWLTVTPTNGDLSTSGNQLVVVGLNATGWSAGKYSGEIKISSNDPVKPIITVPVSLTIIGAPSISMTDKNITVDSRPAEPKTVKTKIVNAGNTPLTWSFSAGLPSWVTTNKTSGVVGANQEDEITFIFNGQTLSIGTYNNLFDINSNDPVKPKVNVSLTLNVIGNKAPVVVTTIPSQKLVAGGDAIQIDLNNKFSDPERDFITFSSISSNEKMLVTQNSGTILKLFPLKPGDVVVSVIATDLFNASVKMDFNVTVTPVMGIEEPVVKTGFKNAPNPFQSTTAITYDLKATAHVQLLIYDLMGMAIKEIVNGNQQPGRKEVIYDGSDLSAGTYICQLVVNGVLAEGSRIIKL